LLVFEYEENRECPMTVRGRPRSVWLLVLLLGQLSVRASIGGLALLIAPSGALVGLSPRSLDTTLVGDFFLPGLVLLVAFGLVPSVVCYGLYTRREWAWPTAIVVALALLAWVVLEVAIGFARPTVYLNVGTTIGIVSVALHPAVRRDCRDATV
jgi:hypothetical protein